MDPAIRTRIVKRLRQSEVFHAVGLSLKSAMIAREVMDVLSAQHFQNVPILPFAELYDALRHELMPEYFKD